jgi:hypothetical protein
MEYKFGKVHTFAFLSSPVNENNWHVARNSYMNSGCK